MISEAEATLREWIADPEERKSFVDSWRKEETGKIYVLFGRSATGKTTCLDAFSFNDTVRFTPSLSDCKSYSDISMVPTRHIIAVNLDDSNYSQMEASRIKKLYEIGTVYIPCNSLNWIGSDKELSEHIQVIHFNTRYEPPYTSVRNVMRERFVGFIDELDSAERAATLVPNNLR